MNAEKSIDDLPDEILGLVVRELKPRERVSAEAVNSRWKRVR